MLVSEHIVGLTDIGLCSLRIHTFQLLWIWSWLYHCDCWAALSTWVTIESSKKLMVRLCEGVSRMGKVPFCIWVMEPHGPGPSPNEKGQGEDGLSVSSPIFSFLVCRDGNRGAHPAFFAMMGTESNHSVFPFLSLWGVLIRVIQTYPTQPLIWTVWQNCL